jgi:hypothetical protein
MVSVVAMVTEVQEDRPAVVVRIVVSPDERTLVGANPEP